MLFKIIIFLAFYFTMRFYKLLFLAKIVLFSSLCVATTILPISNIDIRDEFTDLGLESLDSDLYAQIHDRGNRYGEFGRCRLAVS